MPGNAYAAISRGKQIQFPKVLPEADRIVNLWTEIDLQQAG